MFEDDNDFTTGPCEDAPCCGCCGPQGDGDYYGDEPDPFYADYDEPDVYAGTYSED